MTKTAPPSWPADKVERRRIAALIPYARNSRTHSEKQVKQIAASMREFGWTIPMLVDERDGIIAGHGRVLAAELLGWEEGPVMVARGWSEAQKRAYVIADNKLALNAGWDHDLLKVELEELETAGFDLDLTGFDADEVGAILAGETLDIEDDGSIAGTAEQEFLRWADYKIGLSDQEKAQLSAAYEAHMAANGVAFGFIASLLRKR
jgi:ParB-like chromosome segregation protein Spo0J